MIVWINNQYIAHLTVDHNKTDKMEPKNGRRSEPNTMQPRQTQHTRLHYPSRENHQRTWKETKQTPSPDSSERQGQRGQKIKQQKKQGKSEGFDSCDRPRNLTQIGLKSSDFLVRMTLKFDGWPRMIIEHLFYITSSFVHHLKPHGEFKLELLSGNAQFGSKPAIFLSCVTLQFDAWPWKTIGHLFYVASSFMHYFIAISEFKLKLQSGNAQFGSTSAIFLPRVTLKFDRWSWKTIGNLFYATSRFVHHFVAIGEFKLELQSGNARFRSKSTIFLAVWPWNLTDDLKK